MGNKQARFFVDYENTRFLQTSQVKALPYRLNWRCEVLLTRHQQAITGKRVLDLASHDGRFSYACLKLGARHVTGVEGREYLIKSATENLTALGYTEKQFSFIQGDVFDYLKGVNPKEFDIILCLGIFDHTIRQTEMVREVKRIHPSHLILDLFAERGIFINPFKWLKLIGRLRFRHLAHTPETMETARKVVKTERGTACLVFRPESHLKESSTIDPIDLAARPTRAFVEMIFSSHGFDIKQLQWNQQGIKDWTNLADYRDGTRASYIARLPE